ncbi:hypothetical protein GCM10028803_29330 [Larkinella knui]|nr:hypothetical protein [Larkinella knui]
MGGWEFRSNLLTILFFLLSVTVFGQSSRLETQQGLLNAIAPYDADIRQSILTASQYPQVLTQLQQVRDDTRSSFENLINGFDRKKQGWFYELTRYPDLLHTLAQSPNGLNRDAIDRLVPNSDENLHDAAWHLYRNHTSDLVQADNLNQQASRSFDQLIRPFDGSTQASFRQLLNYPDALVLLTNNIELTAELGQQVAANGTDLNQQLATLHDNLAVQHDREVADYKKRIDADPQAGQELNQAARSFAQSNGYILPTMGYGGGMMFANPYSYWFGYPYWYGSPLWYPGAFWGGFSLTYGLGGFGLYGFPAFGFNSWFINRGYYAYPHLYNRFGGYYRTVGPRYGFVPTYRTYGNYGRTARPPYLGSRGNFGGMRSPSVGGLNRSYSPGGRMGSFGGSRGYSGGFHGGGGFRGGSFGGRHR